MTKKPTPPRPVIVRVPEQPSDNQIEAAVPMLPDLNPERARRLLRSIYETFVNMRPDNEQAPDMTKKMAQMMEAIVEYTEENDMSPTQQELADMFGIDRMSVRQRLQSLKRRGYISTVNAHRGIRIIKKI